MKLRDCRAMTICMVRADMRRMRGRRRGQRCRGRQDPGGATYAS